MDLERRAARVACAAALLISAALVVAPWRGHVDDMDAQLYLVVARSMAQAHEWFDLRCLPGFYPRFREHLPFGLWPAIAAIRFVGEWAVNPIQALFTIGAIAVAGRIALRIGGVWSCAAAMVLLGTCESIWHYGGRPLLEPQLLLFATAAAAAALEEKWILAAALGAVATLIKGPFGLLPLACVAAARLPGRRGPIAVFAAVIPLALFLWIDPGGGWRDDYLRGRLLGMADGSNSNGIVLWWYPYSIVARRFWPGFPFLILGLLQSVRNPRLRPLAIACMLMVALLCIPLHKWGNHSYVAFPLLASLSGVAAGSLLARARGSWIAATLVAAAAITWTGSLSGLLARVLPPPCPSSQALASALDSLKPQTALFVVAAPIDTGILVALAAERRLTVFPVPGLPAISAIDVALVRDGIEIPPSWKATAHGGGWSFARRQSEPAAQPH